MKVVLAGAFGRLGSDILRALVRDGHDVLAVDMVLRELDGIEGSYEKKQVDVTKPEQLAGCARARTRSSPRSASRARARRSQTTTSTTGAT